MGRQSRAPQKANEVPRSARDLAPFCKLSERHIRESQKHCRPEPAVFDPERVQFRVAAHEDDRRPGLHNWVEPLIVGLERSSKRNAAAEAGAALVNDAGKMLVMKQLNASGAF